MDASGLPPATEYHVISALYKIHFWNAIYIHPQAEHELANSDSVAMIS